MTKKRHHYLPQFYLRNFVDRRIGRLWVYTKAGAEMKSASPRDLGVEKDYHTVKLRGGKKDRHTIEETVATLENTAAPVIRKILGGEELTFDDHQIFAVFVAQMVVRVPASRDAVGRMTAELLRNFAKGFAAEKESYHADYRRFQRETGDRSDVDPEDLRKFILGDDYKLEVNPSAALGLSLGSIGTVANCLVRMNWVFVNARGRFKFLTCDNPVFYCDPTIPPGSWRGVGLANFGVEVSFPMSPDILAFGCYRAVPRNRISVSAEVVRRFNQQTIDSAYRYVFAVEGSMALQRFILRNNKPNSRVEQDE